MQVFTNQRPVQYEQNLFTQGRREARRNTEMTVGDNRHTRKMLASDMEHLSATVHLSTSGLAGYYQQQLGNFVTNEQMTEFFFGGNGMAGVMDNFETLHAHITENFDGIERDRRLEGLERAFLELAKSFAWITATDIMQESGVVMSDEGATGKENSPVRRAWDKMQSISTNIFEMFQSSLGFFRLNGTFAGFANTSNANRPGMLSFNDFEMIAGTPRNRGDGSSTGVISALPLSNSGREFMNGVMQGDFLR